MGKLYHGNFGNGPKPPGNGGIWKAPVVNLDDHRPGRLSAHRFKVPKVSGYEAIHAGVAAAGAIHDYHNARTTHYLTKRQAATTAGVGTGIAYAGHHVGTHLTNKFTGRIAMDVGGAVVGGIAQDRMIKHYQARNRSRARGRR